MADPYANAANQYGQEMELGTRLNDSLNQRNLDATNGIYDRFMQAYQMQVRQKMMEQQLAHQQAVEAARAQHEATYLQMAKDREQRDFSDARHKLVGDVSKNLPAETVDPGVETQGDALRSTLPPDLQNIVPDAKLQPSSKMPIEGDKGLPALDTGALPGVPAIAPVNPATIEGPDVKVQPGGAQWTQKESDTARKVQHDTWKKTVEQAKVAALQQTTDSKGVVDKERANLISTQAQALQDRIDSGEFDLKPDLMRAQISHLSALTANVGKDNSGKPMSEAQTVSATLRAAGQIGNTVEGMRMTPEQRLAKAREQILSLRKPKTSGDPLVGTKTKYPTGTKLKDGRTITVDANGTITKVE